MKDVSDGTTALDRVHILDAVAKYAWGYDEGDFDLLADSFTEDATSVGKVTASDIGWGPMHGRSHIVEILSRIRSEQTDQRRHTIHTHRFESQTSTAANLSLYLVVLGTESGQTRVVTAGRYTVDAIKEADGVWRMKRLDAVLDSAF